MIAQPEYRNNKLFYIVLLCAVGVAFAVIATITGCPTAHKATKYMVNHKPVGATFCSVNYPCQDSVHETILYKEGEVVVNTDTVYNTDTVTVDNVKYVTKTVYRDVVKTRVDTVTTWKVAYQTDKAKEAVLQGQADSLVTANKTLSGKYTNAKAWMAYGWLSLLIVVIIGFIMRSLKI